MIYLVTGNKNKLREFEEILGFKLSHIDLDLEEIQAVEVEKVIEHKTRQAFSIIKKPVVCEDSGLYLDAWRGLPGALVKFFEKTIGYRNLCKLLGSDRKAKAQTVIGYFDGKNYFNFTGEVSGKIAQKPEGKNGFGWDVVFIPNRSTKTFAQMTPVEKNKISMRKIALEKLRKFLA
jgi:XTP/dITP diphosphohydrolase